MVGVGAFLRAWVNSQSDLSARLTGADGKMRVEAWKTAQTNGDFPRIVYFQVEGSTVKTLSRPLSLRRDVYQVEVQSERYAEAREVADMLVGNPEAGDQRLDGYSGTLGGVKVQGFHLSSQSDLADGPLPGTDIFIHRCVTDWIAWWEPVA